MRMPSVSSAVLLLPAAIAYASAYCTSVFIHVHAPGRSCVVRCGFTSFPGLYTWKVLLTCDKRLTPPCGVVFLYSDSVPGVVLLFSR